MTGIVAVSNTDEYVMSIRATINRLVAMDVRFGGNAASADAIRELRAALRDARTAGGAPARDVVVAIAELAELTGWLLIDANRHERARRANQLSLRLARAGGDRLMELFVTHNISLQETYLRRPAEGLAIIAPVLDRGRLTPRLESMFRLRAARVHAQMGLAGEAFRLLDHARGLLFEGVSDRDPAWAWWISPNGFDFATAAMHGTLGDWNSAIEPLHRTLAATPAEATRDRFLHLCVLLHAQIEVNAWRDAASTAERLAPLIGTVGSDRPLARLAATVRRAIARPSRLRHAVEPVHAAIASRAGAGPTAWIGPAYRDSVDQLIGVRE